MAFYLEAHFPDGSGQALPDINTPGNDVRDQAFNQVIDNIVGHAEGKIVQTSNGFLRGNGVTLPDKNMQWQEERKEDGRPHKCEICDLSFFTESELFNHMGTHADCQFACGKCDMIFADWEALKVHMPEHGFVPADIPVHENNAATIGKPDSNQYHCVQCGKSFTLKRTSIGTLNPLPQQCTKCYMKAHMLANAQSSFRCLTCGRLFDTKVALSAHMEVHAKEKYKCAPCSRSFATEEELDQHNALFHAARPQSQRKCSVVYGKTDRRGKRSFKCQECQESFSRMADLRTHLNLGLKRYRCKTCGFSFHQKRSLMTHKLTHVNTGTDIETVNTGTLYQCSHCRQAFFQLEVLNAHMEKHIAMEYGDEDNNDDEITIYQCSECGLRFRQIEEVNEHMAMHMPADTDAVVQNYAVQDVSGRYPTVSKMLDTGNPVNIEPENAQYENAQFAFPQTLDYSAMKDLKEEPTEIPSEKPPEGEDKKVKFQNIVQTMCSLLNSNPAS